MNLPEGFRLARGFARAVPIDDLRGAIPWEQRSISMFGRTIPQPRLTAWMGSAAYTYSRQRHEPAPLPFGVWRLRQCVEREAGATFNSVLANLYRDGRDSVAWHADDEPELGDDPVIASLSFGATRDFHVRHNLSRQRWTIPLAHGDLLVMLPGVQRAYQHAIPKARDPVGVRINLTFRAVAG